MDKKLFNIILVVIVGIVIGVGIVSQRGKDPLFRELLTHQKDTLTALNRLESTLAKEVEEDSEDDGEEGDLGARVTALENKLNLLEKLLKQAKGSPGGLAQGGGPPPEDLGKVHEIEVAHTPVLGPKDAPVMIVEFVDFQCPFCARFHPPITEVRKQFPEKVNVMIKNFPLSFHPQARPAAKAALAAGEQGKYFEMADALLANGNQLSEEKFAELAGQIGLDVEKFKKDYKDKDSKWEEMINADLEQGKKVDVHGTPTIFINGKKAQVRDVEGYKREIEAILNQKK